MYCNDIRRFEISMLLNRSFQIMKAAPQDSRLPLRDAVKEMKSTLLEINNQKRQFEIVDR